MAETTKAKEIRAHKEILRATIVDLNNALREVTNSVPSAVRAGSHQMAVEWKELAEKVHGGLRAGGGGGKATTSDLNRLIQKRQKMLKKLTCE